MLSGETYGSFWTDSDDVFNGIRYMASKILRCSVWLLPILFDRLFLLISPTYTVLS